MQAAGALSSLGGGCRWRNRLGTGKGCRESLCSEGWQGALNQRPPCLSH